MLNRFFIIASVLAMWLSSASAQAGVPDLELRVDPLSGAMRIVAEGGSSSFALDGYTIGSASLANVINPGAGGWNSLFDQSLANFAEVVPAGQELIQISELDFTTFLAVSPGAVVSLGNAYDTTSGVQDLVFQYSQAGTVPTIFGNVIYGLAPLEVRVNRFTGAMRIVNPDSVDTINLDGYTIASASQANVINPGVGGWNSMFDQSISTFVEVVPAGQELIQITELDFTGFKAFTPGTIVSLGNAYDTTSGSEDLTFQYSQAGTVATTSGSVIFEDGGLRIRVNKSTGKVEIINTEAAGIDFDAYVIQSAGGLLDNANAAWSSLEDQTVAGWGETASNSFALSELNFTSSSVLAGAGSFDLGTPYTGGVAGAEDLTFDYSVASGVNPSSAVEYIIAGDMDGDGDVDTADVPLFIQALVSRAAYDANGFINSAGFLVDADSVGDVDGSGTFDLGDLSAFGGIFAPATASASAVPEPGSASLVMILGALVLIGRHRK